MSDEAATESFEIAGARFTRHGRLTEIETHRTPEQQRAMDAALAASRQQAEKRIAAATREIERELGKYRSFDILSNLLVAGMATDETYKGWSHQVNQPHLEYATLLALKGGFRAHGDPPKTERIEQLLNEVFRSAYEYYRGEHAARKDPPDAAAELRFRTIIYGLTDRNTGYENHLHNVLNGLFGHCRIAAWLKTNLGFTVEEALRLNRAVAELGEDRLNERCRVAIEEKQALEMAVRQLRQGKPIPEDLPKEVVTQLAKLNDEEMHQSLENRSVWRTFHELGDTMSFRAEELAEAARACRQIEDWMVS